MALVSNNGEKLTTTEGKEVELWHKAKRAKNAFQDLFTTAIDKGKSIASQKAKKLAAMDFNPRAVLPQKVQQILPHWGRMLRAWLELLRISWQE